MTRCPVVLLLDPNQDERDLYAGSLRQSGFDVRPLDWRVTHDGHALDLIAAEGPDVIVAHVHQPGAALDGFGLAQALRNHPGTRHVPVVLMTTFPGALDEGRARAAGCRACLRLPMLPGTFVAEVMRVLGHGGRQSATG